MATWSVPEWWKPIAIILMLPAFLLAVIGLTTPNPTSVGQEGRVARSPEGIVRVTLLAKRRAYGRRARVLARYRAALNSNGVEFIAENGGLR
jgi:hypothetical protein